MVSHHTSHPRPRPIARPTSLGTPPSHPPATRLLVVVDQFEELFTQVERAGQSAFLTTLLALRAGEAATLVLLVRSAFYPDLEQSVPWPAGGGDRPGGRRADVAEGAR